MKRVGSFSNQRMPEKRKRSDEIKTFVFLDVSTDGFFQNSSNNSHVVLKNSNECEEAFRKSLDFTDKQAVPRILDMTLLAVNKSEFRDAFPATNLGSPSEQIKKIITVPVHPQLNTDEEAAEHFKKIQKAEHFNYKLHQQKKRLKEVWPEVQTFLNGLEAPLCFISHTGIDLKFRALLLGLKFSGIELEKAFPEKTYFVDCFQAFRFIANDFQMKIKGIFDEIICPRVVSTSLNLGEQINEKSNNFCGGVSPSKTFRSNNSNSTEANSRNYLPNNHPFRFLTINKWPFALRRIFTWDYFETVESIPRFNEGKFKNNNSLSYLYEQIWGKQNVKYGTKNMDGTEKLLQICLAYQDSMIDYIDDFAVQISK